MSSGWGCPHDAAGQCQRVPGQRCDPGMKGCILAGRFIFSDSTKNTEAAKKNKIKNPGSEE